MSPAGAKRRRAEQTIEAAAAPRTAVPLTWIHTPQQDRSKKTLERLLDATESIIREKGVEAVTVPSVTRAAKSSVGSFYARFPDKASLLRTLHERACEQSIATAAAALDPSNWQGIPTADLVRGFVGFCVRLFAERRPMMLAFSASLSGDSEFAARRARTAKVIGKHVETLLLHHRDSIGHRHPSRAIAMSLRVVTATLEQRNGLELGGEPDVAISDELLIEELSTMVLRYLDVAAG